MIKKIIELSIKHAFDFLMVIIIKNYYRKYENNYVFG